MPKFGGFRKRSLNPFALFSVGCKMTECGVCDFNYKILVSWQRLQRHGHGTDLTQHDVGKRSCSHSSAVFVGQKKRKRALTNEGFGNDSTNLMNAELSCCNEDQSNPAIFLAAFPNGADVIYVRLVGDRA